MQIPTPAQAFEVLDVLAEAGPERDRFCAAIGDPGCDDEGLIRATLAASGRPLSPGLERAGVAGVSQLAALARAVRACVDARIDLEELRAGVAAIAAASANFDRLGPARALARTVAELLAGDGLPARAVRRQLAVLHDHLRAELAEQLVGDPHGIALVRSPTSSDAWRDQYRILDHERRDAADRCASEWLDEAAGGARRASWVRGWAAVPVSGEQFGEDPAEQLRLAEALAMTTASALIQVKLARPSRYLVQGTRATVQDQVRRAYEFPPDVAGARRATSGDRGQCLFTTPDEQLVVLELEDHHLVSGPVRVVELICGRSAPEAFAAFREHVESLATDDDDPPEHLLDAARRYGHGRRRSS